MIIDDFRQLDVSLTQLYEDILLKNYVDKLTNAFMN